MSHYRSTAPNMSYQLDTRDYQVEQQAYQLYQQICGHDWLDQVWSALARRPRYLLDLTALQAACAVYNCAYLGIQTVPLQHIRGSGSRGRSQDFDADFRPLQSRNKRRWLDLAIARQLGVRLPPVVLIQINDIYFVEDGHHRISVARARQEPEIEAEVTLWQIRTPYKPENHL